jgi:hypothetical protein
MTTKWKAWGGGRRGPKAGGPVWTRGRVGTLKRYIADCRRIADSLTARGRAGDAAFYLGQIPAFAAELAALLGEG